MNARKYPRTLDEAFGPYARGPVHEKPEPESRGHQVLEAVMPVLLVVVVGALAMGVM
jgi:hypothetical protein